MRFFHCFQFDLSTFLITYKTIFPPELTENVIMITSNILTFKTLKIKISNVEYQNNKGYKDTNNNLYLLYTRIKEILKQTTRLYLFKISIIEQIDI